MKLNEASWDRIGRVVLGVALIGTGILAVGGGWGWALAAVGLIPLVTGIVGWCPIYPIIAIRSNHVATNHPVLHRGALPDLQGDDAVRPQRRRSV
jgi:hypothetical protein